MKQAIRALGWAANIFWIILLFFTITAVYSAFQLGVGFEEPYTSTQDGTLTVSLPFSIKNDGFYEISDLNVTTLAKDKNGSLISSSSTFVKLIPIRNNVSVTHNFSISVSQMTTENLSYLLFNNSDFDVDLSLKLTYANVVPFQISTNLTMPWGAPLNNLSIASVSLYNETHVSVSVSFVNYSPFSLDGTIKLELVDNMDVLLGSGTANIVPSESSYSFPFLVSVSDPNNIRKARLYFNTTIFRYGWVVIPLV